jgi:hypothetical protein
MFIALMAFALLAVAPASACSVYVPQYPFTSVFDGANVWVVSTGVSTGSGSLVAIDPRTCEIIQTNTGPTPAFASMGTALGSGCREMPRLSEPTGSETE